MGLSPEERRLLKETEVFLVITDPGLVAKFRGRWGERLGRNSPEKSESRKMIKIALLFSLVSILAVAAATLAVVLYLQHHHLNLPDTPYGFGR